MLIRTTANKALFSVAIFAFPSCGVEQIHDQVVPVT